MQLTGYQKIHIISVGFEVDRAYLPVVKIGGDKVYLIRDHNDTPDSDKIFRKYINEVERLLREHNIKEIQEVECDIFDISNLISVISHLIKTENENRNIVMTNVSSGSRLYSAAAIISSMMFGAKAYYARVGGYNIPDTDKRLYRDGRPMGITWGVKEPFTEIPDFELKAPKEDLIEVLSIIDSKPGQLTQSDIIRELYHRGIMPNVEFTLRDETGIKRKYLAEFRRKYLEPMMTRRWLKKIGSRRNAKIVVTEEGKTILTIFEGVYLEHE